MDCESKVTCSIGEKEYHHIERQLTPILKRGNSGDSKIVLEISHSLRQYDTDINSFRYKDGVLEIEIYPNNFPDDFYEVMFPYLEENGATKIKGEDHSEYGQRVVTYSNGSLSEEQSTPIENLQEHDYFAEESDSTTIEESPWENQDLSGELYSNVLNNIKKRIPAIQVSSQKGIILGLDIDAVIIELKRLHRECSQDVKNYCGSQGSKTCNVTLNVFSGEFDYPINRTELEFKRVFKTQGISEVNPLIERIRTWAEEQEIDDLSKKYEGICHNFRAVWEWQVDEYILYVHVEDDNSYLSIRLGVVLPRKYLFDLVNNATDALSAWNAAEEILNHDIILERNMIVKSLEGYGYKNDDGHMDTFLGIARRHATPK